ncbi:MAG TPA: non-ribosomal peptide synthetase [Candidatus Binatia bacterium]|nr:non-ribosomal peptide synthetase [Candidatus Binatia bacterium]
MKLPSEQQAIRDKCFHPSGMFVEFPNDAIEHSIPGLFEKIVRMYPDRVAVKTKNLLLTYAELNRAANQLACAIVAQCAEEKEPAAVCLAHGADVIIAVLALWKAGKIFVPLDPSLPHSRNKAILDATQARLVVSDARHRDYLGQVQTDLHVINIDEPAGTAAAENIGDSIAPDDLAYILFTSGSTGQPKGVLQNHRNVLNQIKRETNGLHICANDRLILVRSCSAIGGIRIVLSALLNGAAVYPLDVAQVGHTELTEVLAREEITIYDSTPTTFHHFISALAKEQRFPHLRLIRLSSEPVHKQDVDLYKKYFSRDCIFANSLGLTETAGTIRHNLIDHDTKVTSDTVPVGYAVEEMEVMLLDDDGHEVRADEIGEIAVRSRYLSPGYWANPDLTQAKFIVAPDGGDKRLYLTGDLGQMLDDGNLVHLGRKDFQVKVRGYKVDVGEIERALLALESIEAVVVVARADRDDNLRLIAYLVSATTPAPTNSALRRALSDKLPEYMIPSSFVLLDVLPTTPTGKVDRGRLPLTDRTRPALDAVFVRPRSERERSLTRIWQDVLHIDNIGIDDNFFDLGGNSLRLAEVNLKMRTVFKTDIPLVEMFALPTVRTLAEYFTRPGNKLAKLHKSHDRAKIRRALKERRKR